MTKLNAPKGSVNDANSVKAKPGKHVFTMRTGGVLGLYQLPHSLFYTYQTEKLERCHEFLLVL